MPIRMSNRMIIAIVIYMMVQARRFRHRRGSGFSDAAREHRHDVDAFRGRSDIGYVGADRVVAGAFGARRP